MPAPGRDLPRLTSLRAFAALMVFAFHIGHDTTWGPGGTTFRLGFVGVGFFFILSGFVLTWSTKPTTTPRAFWLRRVARVYPAYLVMLLISLVVPVTAYPVNAPAFFTNLFLIQAWFPQWDIAFGLNAVSWSLSCEAFFYLCAPFIISRCHRWSVPRLTGLLVGWFLVTAAITLGLGFGTGFDIYAYTNPMLRSGEFALGIWAAMLVIRGRLPRVPISLAVAAAAVVWLLTNFRLLPQSVVDLCFDGPFLLVVLAGATTDLAGRGGPLTWRPLIYAGQVSYCFYLVHELVILNGNLLWGTWAHGRLQGSLLMIVVLAISTLAAMALHHLVELPAQAAIRRWASRPRPELGAPA